jgi:hypothetical protein
MRNPFRKREPRHRLDDIVLGMPDNPFATAAGWQQEHQAKPGCGFIDKAVQDITFRRLLSDWVEFEPGKQWDIEATLAEND